MRLPEEPSFPVLPSGQPTRDLLLAQALDACIAAERRVPGSSQQIIARQPAWARGDLQRLLGLAGSLDAAASNAVMSTEFRAAARARLMRRIGGEVSPAPRRVPASLVQLHSVSAFNIFPPLPGLRRRPGKEVRSPESRQLAPMLSRAGLVRAAASLLNALLALAATLTGSLGLRRGAWRVGRQQRSVRAQAADVGRR